MSGASPTGPASPAGRYRLVLFVAGEEKNSRLARENLQRLCDAELGDDCEVRIVDVLEDFAPALAHNVLLTPALLVLAPPPETMIVGNLKDRGKVLTALGLGGSSEAA